PEDGAGRGVLGRHRRVVAPGAEVQEVRRVVLVEAHRPVVVEGDIHLAVTFNEAGVLFGDVAVDRQRAGDGVGIAERADGAARVRARNARTRDRSGVVTGAARIEVTPDTEVEGEHADRRADTAVDVDF